MKRTRAQETDSRKKRKVIQPCYITEIPIEILHNVLDKWLMGDIKDLRMLRLVSRYFHAVAHRIAILNKLPFNAIKVYCHCRAPQVFYTNSLPARLGLSKSLKNPDREFFTCGAVRDSDKCNFFAWNDSNSYSRQRWKINACWRCLRYNCEKDTCQQIFDYYGNLIPPHWQSNIYD